MRRDEFFIVLIKAIGLYCLINFTISNIPFIIESFNIVNLLFNQVFPIVLYCLIIYKAPLFVKVLNLKNYIETDYISINTSKTKILIKVILIAVGVFLIISNLTEIGLDILKLIVSNTEFNGLIGGDYRYMNQYRLINHSLKCLLGFILVTRSHWISNLLLKDSN